MRKRLKEVIVVEGRDDTTRLQEVFDVDTIETNGSAVNEQTMQRIEKALERRGVIIFTDPDFPGDRIRARINERVPGCKHAYLPRAQAKDKRGKIGVEHASPVAIEEALAAVYETEEAPIAEVTREMILAADLIGGPAASIRRRRLGQILAIGEPNAKQLVKRVASIRITRAEWEAALKQLEEEEV
ncbi:ribonuclease M5 [Exiguobacterium acetylicum]|uniref:ribonuclease M5 n=1 Tax=Exiguobacterium acetylicum TaxID=41170 RepID=UPI001EE27C9A|nr:ribonuclease M5 [Exiguobacterium acetylicum]UKS56130.1 ribonuclease M5 [Exiguobacterium acetylicum]